MRLPGAWNRLRRDERTSRRQRARVARLVHAGRRRGGAAPKALDPVTSAKVAGLRYVNDLQTPGIRRMGTKHRVHYVGPDGRTVHDRATLERIRALVIPPAWTGVWICPYPNGHLQ